MTQYTARWTAASGYLQIPHTNHNLACWGSPEFLIITKEIKALSDYPQTFCYKSRYYVLILASGPSRIWGWLHTTMSPAFVCTWMPCFPIANARFTLTAQEPLRITSARLCLLSCVRLVRILPAQLRNFCLSSGSFECIHV